MNVFRRMMRISRKHRKNEKIRTRIGIEDTTIRDIEENIYTI